MKKRKIEKELVERLQSNVDKNGYDAGAEAVKHLLPRWEIRTVTKQDPIVEETRIIRKFVKEVDDRYHRYVLKKEEEAIKPVISEVTYNKISQRSHDRVR